jgi:hypothetical protein
VISKIFAVILAAAALAFQRPRLIVFLNYWFTVLVSWNLLMVLVTVWPR